MVELNPAQSQDTFAVALVLESSLAIAQQWPRIYSDYLTHMLSRLKDTLPAHKARMAFVSYASADVFPSPLLSRRFFDDPAKLVREVNENPYDMGLGRSNSGEARGMAALDGLVAAVELFDVLRNTSNVCEQSPVNVFHIFHIVASAADTAEHPRWNDDPSLDHVSWSTLPAEFVKRNINYDLISLKPQPQFRELHSSVATTLGSITPWFQLHSDNTVLLTGFVALDKIQNKRPGEQSNSLQSPETKKPRLETPSEPSPKPKNSATPTLASAIAPAPSAQPVQPSAPQAQPQIQPPQTQILRMLPLNVLKDRMTAATVHFKNLETEIQRLRQAGRQQEANQKESELKEKKYRFNQMVAMQHALHRQAQAQAQAQSGQARVSGLAPQTASNNANAGANSSTPPPEGTSTIVNKEPVPPVFGQATTLISPSVTMPAASDASSTAKSSSVVSSAPQQSPAHLMQMPQQRPPVPPNFNQGPNNQSPNLAAAAIQTKQVPPQALATQMAKLVEQQQRISPTGSFTNPTPTAPTQNETSNQPLVNPGPLQAAPGLRTGGEQPAQGPQHRTPIWSGAFVVKDVRIYVQAAPMSASDSRPDTWPSLMHLMFPRQSPVTRLEFMEWAKRHQPSVCVFTPRLQGIPEPAKNGAAYAQLASLLCRSPNTITFMTASWTLPSGAQEIAMLLFGMVSPHNGPNVLYGALFPLTGVPELPKPLAAHPSQVPQSQPQPPLPPAFINQISMLPPERRNNILNAIRNNPAAYSQIIGMAQAQTQAQPAFGLGQSHVTQQQHPQAQPQVTQGLVTAGSSLPMASGPQVGGASLPSGAGTGLNFMQTQQHQAGSQGHQNHELMNANHIFALNAHSGGTYASLGTILPTGNPVANASMSMGQGGSVSGLMGSVTANGIQSARLGGQYEMMQAFMQRSTTENGQGMK